MRLFCAIGLNKKFDACTNQYDVHVLLRQKPPQQPHGLAGCSH